MKKILSFCLMMLGLGSYAQQENDILFTIDGDAATLGEYRNLFDNHAGEPSIDAQQDYLELFINYKLKLREAVRLGLDTLPAYLSEVSDYRKQLVTSFTKNPDVMDKLVKEAYARSQEEIHALNLLIMVPENAKPEDTLAAYNKMREAHDKLKKGTDFTEIALAYSEPKVTPEQVDLGYFSALRMVYPFESAAYNTPEGGISEIFKTRYGYHILKVVNKRPSNGTVTVKQIQLLHGENDSLEQLKIKKIKDLHAQLLKGVVFDSLAKHESEDPASAARGGLMQSFSIGQISVVEFQEAAFALMPGEISEPFETRFGWHIVQMVKRVPLGDFETNKDLLAMRVQRDSRSSLIEDAKIDWLKQQYKIVKNEENLAKLSENHPNWVVDTLTNFEIFKIEDKTYNRQNLLTYYENLFRNPRQAQEMQQASFATFFDAFFKESLQDYHQTHLEFHNPEFKNVLQKYQDGLLVFNLLEKEVWQKSQQDSLGLKAFYEKNKQQYNQNLRRVSQSENEAADSWKTPLLLSDYQDYYEKKWLEGLRKKYRVQVSENAEKLINP
ncbi:MAG: peptidylprolyl isomerase [Flavobacteriaceae bacterium]|nr:peptidylprolyl isomerase [Flavobacteriaceae bacterium]